MDKLSLDLSAVCRNNGRVRVIFPEPDPTSCTGGDKAFICYIVPRKAFDNASVCYTVVGYTLHSVYGTAVDMVMPITVTQEEGYTPEFTDYPTIRLR